MTEVPSVPISCIYTPEHARTEPARVLLISSGPLIGKHGFNRSSGSLPHPVWPTCPAL